MNGRRWSVRKGLAAAALLAGIAAAAAGCGTSSANPATQTHSGGANAPVQTTPPSTAASGGVSY